MAFFNYFYLAMNFGSLFSDTILRYLENEGFWVLGFWASTASAFAALLLFLMGTHRYRHFKPNGNPVARFCQVLVAAVKKGKVDMPSGGEELYTEQRKDSTFRRILHTHGFRFLDRAAYISSRDLDNKKQDLQDPWSLCPVTQVEEVKCILRLLPIWLCTIPYSVVFTQMASLFIEQGAAMKTTLSNFRIPPASMSVLNIFSVTIFVFFYHRILDPLVIRIRKSDSKGLAQLQRMGIRLVIAIFAMAAAGILEWHRLEYTKKECVRCNSSRSLSILWQIPQYALIGVSEVFMYVSQLEFFNAQAPDGLKSFGSALCMTSISLGNYVSSLLVSMVMQFSTEDHMPGWIPGNLNKGHLDWFFFLLAELTLIDLIVYIACAKLYRCIKLEERMEENEE